MARHGPASRLACCCKSNKTPHSVIDNKLRTRKMFVFFVLFRLRLQVYLYSQPGYFI